MLFGSNLTAVIVWLGFNVFCANVLAQDTNHEAASTDSALEAPLLDWSHARQVYRQIEAWIQAGIVQMDESASPILVSDVAAARVTLRWLGKRFGVGEAAVPLDSPMTTAVDLRRLVAAATTNSLKALQQTIHDTQRHASVNKQRKGMDLAQIGPRLLVDLQLARHPDPITIVAKAPPDQIFRMFAPGYHGLVMVPRPEQTDQVSSWLWPASMLASNVQPESQLVQLLSSTGTELSMVSKLGRPDGPAMARFQIIHLVRPARDMPVTDLVRGNVILPPRPISSPTLDAISQRLATFLKARQRSDGSMAGTYLPTSDRYEPAEAPDQDVALSAYALSRRAAYLAKIDPDGPAAAASQDASRLTVHYLARKLLLNEDFDQPAAAALLVVALAEAPHLGDRKAERDALAHQLMTLANEDGSFRSSRRKEAKKLTLADHAVIFLALSALYERTREQTVGVLLARSGQRLWQNGSGQQLPQMLPWLALAEFRLHRLSSSDLDQQRAWNKKVRALSAVVETLRAVQITDPPEIGPPDMVGGFDLAREDQRRHGPTSPDWHTARFLAFLATALRQREIIPAGDRFQHLLTCGLATRFIGQLMIDEPNAYYIRSLPDAQGGVRLSLWDNRLSVGPAALALLATTELQETITQLWP